MLRRFLNLFRHNWLEADSCEEIEFHRAQSSGSFGSATLIAERMRDASTIEENSYADVYRCVQVDCKMSKKIQTGSMRQEKRIKRISPRTPHTTMSTST